MNKIKKTIYFAVFFQIGLMISLTVATSYMINESEKPYEIEQQFSVDKKKVVLSALRIFNKIFFSEKNFVSASEIIDSIKNATNYDVSLEQTTTITANDLTAGVYTCPKDKQGRICQHYPSSSCAENCAENCVPTTRDQTSMCKSGTCYNPISGKCSNGATKGKCELDGGKWFDDVFGNIAECREGCCI